MADLFRKVIDPFVRRNRWSKAAQQQHFKRVYNVFDKQGQKYNRQTIPSATDMEDVSTVSAVDFQKQVGYWNSFVYHSEPGKLAKLRAWREMSFFPDISFALGEINDEGVSFDANGDFITFEIKNQRLLQNENIIKNLNKEWNYIYKDVSKAQSHVNEWFNDFMIDGEFMFEKVIDPTAPKERGIIRLKRLRPEFTFPIWEPESEDVYQFVHKNESNILILPPEAVAYANSGIFAWEDRYSKVVLSYLERAKIDYRKLKQMEDAVVIYRLVKAPERRIFKIEVGNLPKAKAEAYTRELMRKYRQRKTYNPETGEAGEIYDPQAMIEDFFFPQQNGKGSSVDTLPGGQNLGEIEDVDYFRKKLYTGLRIPLSRLNEESGFSLGDTSDITRDEVRFHKMVLNFSNRFSDLFKQIFLTHLRLKGYIDEYGISDKDIRIKMFSNNVFEEYVESNVLTLRTENMEKLMQFAEPKEEGQKPLLAEKFILKKVLKLTPEEIIENKELLEQQEKEKASSSAGSDSGGESLSDALGGEDSEPDLGSSSGPEDTSLDSFA